MAWYRSCDSLRRCSFVVLLCCIACVIWVTQPGHSITMTPLGIVALCGAVAMVFYLIGRLWSEKGEWELNKTKDTVAWCACKLKTDKKFADLHRHLNQRQNHRLIHLTITKRKDDPPRYYMAEDHTSDDIDGVALFQVPAMVLAAMDKLNDSVLDKRGTQAKANERVSIVTWSKRQRIRSCGSVDALKHWSVRRHLSSLSETVGLWPTI